MNGDGTYRYLADTRRGGPIHAQAMLQKEAEDHTRQLKKKDIKTRVLTRTSGDE